MQLSMALWCAALHGGVCSSPWRGALAHSKSLLQDVVLVSVPWRAARLLVTLLVGVPKCTAAMVQTHSSCGSALPCAPCSNGRALARGLVYGSPRRGHRFPGHHRGHNSLEHHRGRGFLGAQNLLKRTHHQFPLPKVLARMILHQSPLLEKDSSSNPRAPSSNAPTQHLQGQAFLWSGLQACEAL